MTDETDKRPSDDLENPRTEYNRDEDSFPGLNDLVGTFMREPSLWPVLTVVLGSVGAFGGAMLSLTYVDRNPFAAIALLLVLGLSCDIAWRSRKEPGYRNLARFVGLAWFVAALFAGLALYTGIAYS